MSVVVPMIMAVLLICGSKRGGMVLAFAVTFVLGGLASFVLAMGVNRLVVPVEELLAGAPGSIRGGWPVHSCPAAFSEELARS